MHRTQNLVALAVDTDDNTLPSVTPADLLRGAATYLQTRGWTQDVYYGGKADEPFPPACADGAIGMAAYGRTTTCPGRETSDPAFRDYHRAVTYFNGYLGQTGWKPPCEPWCGTGNDCLCVNDDTEIVFGWNDDDTRTAAEAIAALTAAAGDYDRTHNVGDYADTTPVSDQLLDILLDVGGYLACGCHGSQREHTCGGLE